jgi:hypothetical protein
MGNTSKEDVRERLSETDYIVTIDPQLDKLDPKCSRTKNSLGSDIILHLLIKVSI